MAVNSLAPGPHPDPAGSGAVLVYQLPIGLVAELKAEALEGANDRLYKVADLLRVLTEFGLPIPRSTLCRWARDRRIEPRGWEHRDGYGTRITDHRISESDVQVYRLGDARALAAKDARGGGSEA
ncbi:hypothetical protein [Nocardia niwae]|uniref:hypothetical protein n=1 Tax=Nocardia niwae TaxID=626084 RepID=UPI0033C174AC